MQEVSIEKAVAAGSTSSPLLEVKPNGSIGYRIFKRAFDVISSICMLVLTSWVFIIVAIAIWIDSPGKVIFVQERNGLNGKIFKMYKFRSMCKDAPKMRAALEDQNELDGPAFKIANDIRVTRVGKFIRRTSIDELPQLWNVLLGSMSVVGPRPLPTYETAQLTPYQRQRLLVKPGLVCYWQISGRNDIAFNEWMEMDLRYINNANALEDLKIVFKAIPAVLMKKGAY